MQFTKDELYIIERTMDNLCSNHIKGVAQTTTALGQLEVGKKIIEKMMDSWVE